MTLSWNVDLFVLSCHCAYNSFLLAVRKQNIIEHRSKAKKQKPRKADARQSCANPLQGIHNLFCLSKPQGTLLISNARLPCLPRFAILTRIRFASLADFGDIYEIPLGV